MSRFLNAAAEHVLEREEALQRRMREPAEQPVEARAQRADTDQRPHFVDRQPRLLHQLERVAPGEPAQVRAVEDPLLAAWPPAADAELPEGLEKTEIGERDPPHTPRPP